jgi:hypothetical protein
MLKHILDLLPLVEIGKSELIDLAKGKNKMPSNFKELKKQIKWQLNK